MAQLMSRFKHLKGQWNFFNTNKKLKMKNKSTNNLKIIDIIHA